MNIKDSNRQLLEKTIEKITPVSQEYISIAQDRQNNLAKPPGSLGKLEDISIRLAGIYRSQFFETNPKIVIAYGADHGIYEEGISMQPQAVTALHFPNYAKGTCSIGLLSKLQGSDVLAVDIGINTDESLEGVLDRKIRKATSNFAKGPAMTHEEALQSIAAGIELADEYVKKGYRVIGLGEMGICNTSPSSAIVSVISQRDPAEVTGLGAGTPPEGLQHKVDTIRKGIEINNPDRNDPLDILAKVGGFEIGAITGTILGCAANSIPVVLDGFISYAGALLAKQLCPLSVQYMMASHKSAEPASELSLEMLGLSAALDMGMRLGEGSGAVLFFNLIESANQIYKNMMTFDSSPVPDTGIRKEK
ncbi:MAG: nicotinate-nucleotide--dimethylbenzimidazole phosphoribosyltransferase [Proteocatella sp.]|nr:nicotinate-nucleotide--dimethylbenzimidazole phosphoribosyltransferase [Proteocatella sp.]